MKVIPIIHGEKFKKIIFVKNKIINFVTMKKILYVLFFYYRYLVVPINLYTKKCFFSKYEINISIKSNGKYENNVNLMESILNQRLKHKGSAPSNLKLVVSIDRSISDLRCKQRFIYIWKNAYL